MTQESIHRASERPIPSAAICGDIEKFLASRSYAVLPKDIATATGWSYTYVKQACRYLRDEGALVNVGKGYRPTEVTRAPLGPPIQKSPHTRRLQPDGRLPRGFIERALDGASRPMHLSEISARVDAMFGRPPTRRALAVCLNRLMACNRIRRPRAAHYELTQGSMLEAT